MTKRFTLIATNSYQDRDKDWLTLEALKKWDSQFNPDFLPNPTRKNGETIPLRFWHMGLHDARTRSKGAGIDLGVVDGSVMVGNHLVVTGKYKNNVIANAIEPILPQMKVSPGIFHSPEQKQNKEFTDIDIFEFSILPAERASNPLTRPVITKEFGGNTMGQKLDTFRKLVGDEVLEAIIDEVIEADGEAAAMQLTSKEYNGEDIEDGVYVVSVKEGEVDAVEAIDDVDAEYNEDLEFLAVFEDEDGNIITADGDVLDEEDLEDFEIVGVFDPDGNLVDEETFYEILGDLIEDDEEDGDEEDGYEDEEDGDEDDDVNALLNHIKKQDVAIKELRTLLKEVANEATYSRDEIRSFRATGRKNNISTKEYGPKQESSVADFFQFAITGKVD